MLTAPVVKVSRACFTGLLVSPCTNATLQLPLFVRAAGAGSAGWRTQPCGGPAQLGYATCTGGAADPHYSRHAHALQVCTQGRVTLLLLLPPFACLPSPNLQL